MTNLETNFLEVLTREAVHFSSRAVRLFPALTRTNAYGPHTGLFSMVLQRKRSQDRTGHMIISFITWHAVLKAKSSSLIGYSSVGILQYGPLPWKRSVWIFFS